MLSDIRISSRNLAQYKDIFYLGTSISDLAKLDMIHKFGKVGSGFGRLQKTLWNKHQCIFRDEEQGT